MISCENSETNVLKCRQNAEERWWGEEWGREKIGWEMRDCMEPKSQPAVPACCLRDCKLSLRMQTDKQDRHHLPILPSTTETVTHAAPSTPLLFLSFPPLPGGFFCPCTCMYMNSLIYFLYLPPLVLQSLSVDEMSQLAVYAPLSLFNGSLPLHRR